MGITQTHALGRNRKFFIASESTAGTYIKPSATDAAKVLTCSINEEIERANRDDSRQTRSLLERITGKTKVNVSVEAYLIPSGTAGTPPDLHPAFKAALGGYTNTPATSDAYTLSDSQTLSAVSVTDHFNNTLAQSAAGVIVESLTISASGGDRPKVKFEGPAMSYVMTGTSTLNGAMSGSTTMVVQTADGYAFRGTATHGSVVQIGSTANVMVTADASRPSFTVDTSTTESNAAAVIPYAPSETTAGSPLSGLTGSLTVDAVTLPITAFEVTIKNNLKPTDDEAFVSTFSDAIPGFREVTGTVTLRARADFIKEIGKRNSFAARDIQVIIGNTTGSKVQIDIDYAEFGFSAVDTPQSDEAVITLPFVAKGSSGADELSITFK